MIDILITGGCGFIGLNLLDLLLNSKMFNVRIVDDLSVGKLTHLRDLLNNKNYHLKIFENDHFIPKMEGGEVQFYPLDIRNSDSALKMATNIDFIIHLAANTGVIKSIADPITDFEMNAKGTINYLEAAVANKIKGFIFASSSAPLGNREDILHENMAHNPYSPYGASKMAGEGYCSAYYHSYSLETSILRFSNVYGCYSIHKNSVVSKFIKDILLNNEIVIYGDGRQTRDFIHVRDLCKFIEKIIVNELPFRKNGKVGEKDRSQIYHIASGQSISINQLAKTIVTISGKSVKVINKPYRKGEVISSSVDITSTIKKFGFKPEILIEDGIKEVFNWFLKQPEEEILNKVG